jgi:putative transposase
VSARTVSGAELFVDDEDRRAFLWLLGEALARLDITCSAYCLMGTHYHLLLHGCRSDLSAAMKSLNARYVRRFNARHGRHGHLFAERFSAYVVETEEHLARAREYIKANPVDAGLCTTADEWPWTWVSGTSTHQVPVPAVRAA